MNDNLSAIFKFDLKWPCKFEQKLSNRSLATKVDSRIHYVFTGKTRAFGGVTRVSLCQKLPNQPIDSKYISQNVFISCI